MRELDEARDVGTTPERLGELAESGEREVRRAVAGNPNAPWEVLEELAKEFPGEFLENPVGVLRLMGKPEEVFVGLEDYYDHAEFAEAVMREEDVPEMWVQWFVQHKDFSQVEGVKMHVKVAGEMKDQEHGYEDPHVRGMLMRLEWMPLGIVQRLTTAEDVQSRSWAAGQKGLTREILARLAMDQQKPVRKAVAMHEEVPLEILRELVVDKSANVRSGVAKNRKVPVEMLRQLACDKSQLVRRSVAKNERVPKDVLDMLVQDAESRVSVEARLALLRGEDIAEQILRELAQDAEPKVRAGVGQHKRTPEDVLRRLAQDQDSRVREAVAMNEEVAEDVLCAFMQDKSVRQIAALHPRVPLAELCKLEQEEDEEVKRVAKTMRFIREHPQAGRVSFVPVNPCLPLEDKVIVYLDWVEGLEVAWEVKEALMSLLRLVDESGIELLQRSWVPDFIFRWYVDEGNWRERWMVAMHPGTPEDVRERLKRDGNRAVRAARGVWAAR